MSDDILPNDLRNAAAFCTDDTKMRWWLGRAADTMGSQRARIELLEKVLEAASAVGLGSSEWANKLDIAIAACKQKRQSELGDEVEAGIDAALDADECDLHDFVSRGDGTAKCADCGEPVDVSETGAALIPTKKPRKNHPWRKTQAPKGSRETN